MEGALLVTGTFGTGKSTLIEELAELVEERGLPYAAVDLDWLSWTNTDDTDHGMGPVATENLAAVVANYRRAGVRFFLLARAVRDAVDVERIRAAVGVPLTVIRLTLPIEEIERRLAGSVTAGREDDLRSAAGWLADEEAAGIGDSVFANERPIRDLATDVLDLLGWR